MVHECLLKLKTLDVLLVLDLLLDVLIALEELVVLSLSKLKSLVEVCLKLLLQSIHLILLLLNQIGLGRNNLLVTFLHILFPLNCL